MLVHAGDRQTDIHQNTAGHPEAWTPAPVKDEAVALREGRRKGCCMTDVVQLRLW